MIHIDFDRIVTCDRDELFEKASQRRSEQEMALIRQAYKLTEEAHHPQHNNYFPSRKNRRRGGGKTSSNINYHNNTLT